MRRSLLTGGLIVLLAAVLIPGYLGYQNAQKIKTIPQAEPVTVAVSRGDVQKTVNAPGQLVGVQEQMLGVDVDGRLLELSVRPGSVVKAGDVVARLDAAPYESELRAAQIQLAQAKAAHEQQLKEVELAAEAGEAQVESTQAQAPSLTAADVNLQAAQEAETRAAYEYQKAQDRDWEPPEAVEAYRLEWVAAQRAVSVAEADYNDILKQQWAVSQQANAQAKNVTQSNLNLQYLADSGIDPLLRMAVDEAKADLARTTIRAPFDGVVLDVLARPGEQLAAGSNLLLLTDPAQAEVRATVIEEDLSQVAIGQEAEIYFDARPDVVVNGWVERIVPQRVEGEARPLYFVYLALNEVPPEGIFPGMTADASLLVERERNVLRLPRALVTSRADGTATIEVWAGGRSMSKEIVTGLRGDVYVTVLEGLAQAELVVAE